MAVSGRKISGFGISVTKVSEEKIDHSCEPCLAIGQHIEAHGFCVDCFEYLCKDCLAYHQRIKATKHHQLLDCMDKHTIQSKGSAVCTEKCHIHKNEYIKFFCTNHGFLGCNDCITLNHRTCKIDYIPDKCPGIGDSVEYRETLRKLDQKMEDIDAVIKKATLQDKEIDSSYDHVMREIMNFRKEIDARLDHLQNQIRTDAEKSKSVDKQRVKKVLEAISSVYSDIKELKSNLQDNQTSQQNGQLYIMIKQAKSKLKMIDVKNAQESLEEPSIQYTFEKSKELENFLTKQNIFGMLSQPTTLVIPRKKKAFDKLTLIEDMNVETWSDQNQCYISGCAVLSTNELVLADCGNNKLKIIDTQSKVVIEEKSLYSEPWGIAVLPQDKIAVTMPGKHEILIMSTTGKLSISRKIPVHEYCRDITYHQGQLYVICWDPCWVIILDTEGNVNDRIPLNSKMIDSPNYILLSEDARLIYISNWSGSSDYDSYSVVSVTLQGDVSAVYDHWDLIRPTGMTMLEDGSLLVCCCSGTIHRISGDLKQGKTILDGLKYPRSICYNRHDQEVYIGGDCDQLRITKITWKK